MRNLWDLVSDQRLTFALSAIYVLKLNVANFLLFTGQIATASFTSGHLRGLYENKMKIEIVPIS